MHVWITSLAILVGAGASHAAAQPIATDAAEGKQLAELWCSSCHLVSPEQASASTEAPPFETIAEHSSGEFSWLAAFLADPHPPMPQFALSREEIRNLAAYFASLRRSE